MSGDHEWNVDGDDIQSAMERLPEEWTLRIDIVGGAGRPYIILLDESGDAIADGPDPVTETMAESIRRLTAEAELFGQ